MVAACECADRLDPDVDGEHEERDRDQDLSATLRAVRAAAGAGEEPYDDEPGEGFDEAVRAEADQCDRARGDPRADRDRELDDVPGDATPGKHPRAALELVPLGRRADRSELDEA
jgi:hypothetical protein